MPAPIPPVLGSSPFVTCASSVAPAGTCSSGMISNFGCSTTLPPGTSSSGTTSVAVPPGTVSSGTTSVGVVVPCGVDVGVDVGVVVDSGGEFGVEVGVGVGSASACSKAILNLNSISDSFNSVIVGESSIIKASSVVSFAFNTLPCTC